MSKKTTTHSVVLMNMRDGSVQGHAAGCADLKRGVRKFAEPSQADEVWEVATKAEARATYNGDFDYETEGWYDVEWLPCAKHVPAGVEPEGEAAEDAALVTGYLGKVETIETTMKVCGKWTRFYQNGVEVGRVHNDAADAVFALIRKS